MKDKTIEGKKCLLNYLEKSKWLWQEEIKKADKKISQLKKELKE